MMDAKQLQAIEARWAKPLQEKWRHVARAMGNIETESGRGIASCHVYASNVTSEDYITENLANADRIIAAPTDIALLLAEVKRLQAECEKLKNCGNCKDLFETCKAPGMEPRCDKWEAAE